MTRRLRQAILWCLGLVGAGALLGALPLYTPDLPANALEARYATPPSRFIEVEGARIHFRDWGPRDAPALVLVHGLGGSLHVWEGWIAALSRRYRVITLDLPGHGLTGPWPEGDYSIEAYAAVVAKFASTLAVDRFVLGGHSMGGMVAWWGAAGPLRERVTGLILIDASGYPRQGQAGIGLRIARTPLLGEVATWLSPPFLIGRGLRQAYADPQAVTEQMAARHIDLIRREGNRSAMLQRLRSFAPPDIAAIRTIQIPTLILWGAEDRVVDLTDARRFNLDIRGSRLVIYLGAGHYPMQEQAQGSAEDVLAFLDSLPQR